MDPNHQQAGFDHQPQVGQVELDRYCRSCGYNLRQQAVRREPVTGLLLCKCPECGAFEPANQAMTRPRSWFGSLVVLLWLIWIAALGGAVAGAIGGTAGLSYEAGELLSETESLDTPIPDPRDTTGSAVRMISFQYQVRTLDATHLLILTAQALSALGLGMGVSSLFLIFVPHCRRKGYIALALGWAGLAHRLRARLLRGPSGRQLHPCLRDRWPGDVDLLEPVVDRLLRLRRRADRGLPKPTDRQAHRAHRHPLTTAWPVCLPLAGGWEGAEVDAIATRRRLAGSAFSVFHALPAKCSLAAISLRR